MPRSNGLHEPIVSANLEELEQRAKRELLLGSFALGQLAVNYQLNIVKENFN